MNYAGFRHGEAQEVAAALDGDEQPDTIALTLALANALRRIHALERHASQQRDALRGVLDPFHEGQVSIRPEAAGYVQAAIDAGEQALSLGERPADPEKICSKCKRMLPIPGLPRPPGVCACKA